jgi:hypothetical protein
MRRWDIFQPKNFRPAEFTHPDRFHRFALIYVGLNSNRGAETYARLPQLKQRYILRTADAIRKACGCRFLGFLIDFTPKKSAPHLAERFHDAHRMR